MKDLTTKQILKKTLTSRVFMMYLATNIVLCAIYITAIITDHSFVGLAIALTWSVLFNLAIKFGGKDKSPLPYAEKSDSLIPDPIEDLTKNIIKTQELESRQQKRNFHNLSTNMAFAVGIMCIDVTLLLAEKNPVALNAFLIFCLLACVAIVTKTTTTIITEIKYSDQYSKNLINTRARLAEMR